MSYVMGSEEIPGRLAEWQGVLRLQDWEVDVQRKRAREMCLPESMGTCDWLLKKKIAFVEILDPVDFPPNSLHDQDDEITLVHELLHLHVAPFAAEDGSPDDTAQEQMIHALSVAFVRLAREARALRLQLTGETREQAPA